VRAGGDPAAAGGAITVELCGHWEHEPPCRYPHLTEVVARTGETVTIRTLFACDPADADMVRARIAGVLDGGGDWTVLDQGPVPGPPEKATWAASFGA
jgi:hypothetical protein